jgi:hypothetical protein
MLRIPQSVEFVAVSIVEFKRAKLLRDARMSGISVEDVGYYVWRQGRIGFRRGIKQLLPQQSRDTARISN